jgi:L-asparaginase II
MTTQRTSDTHPHAARWSPDALAPLLEVWRGDRVESLHLGAVAISDTRGNVVASAGDPNLVTYLRSTAKPFQLLPLIECGAADHFGFSDAELAVMAASHSGRDEHVATVAGILARIEVPAAALQCGAHAPYDVEARTALERSGSAPSTLHNNCSGKHAGMLAWCRYNDAPIENYLDSAHPLQMRIRHTLSALADLVPDRVDVAIDGCSAPCFAMPLAAAARAFAQLAVDGEQAHAPLARIAAAMVRHPEMVGGPGRLDTEIMRRTGGRVVSKAGAECYQGLALRDLGLGVAFKIADGLGSRAVGPIAFELLEQLGALGSVDTAARDWLDSERSPVLTNRAGIRVGHLKPVVQLDTTGWGAREARSDTR